MALSREDGILWTWGNNIDGELGFYVPEWHSATPMRMPTAAFQDSPIAYINAGYGHSMAVTADGVLWACGCGRQGQLGLGDGVRHREMQRVGGSDFFDGQRVRMSYCGAARSIIVTMDDSVWACGRDIYACLDIHDSMMGNIPVPVRIAAARFDDNAVVVVGAGYKHAAALTANGRLYTWGACDVRHNHDGLGYYSYEDQYRPTLLDSLVFDNARLGLWHDLYQDHLFAFAMGLHLRLGSTASLHNVPAVLLPIIHDMTRRARRIGTSDGFEDLVGRRVRSESADLESLVD